MVNAMEELQALANAILKIDGDVINVTLISVMPAMIRLSMQSNALHIHTG